MILTILRPELLIKFSLNPEPGDRLQRFGNIKDIKDKEEFIRKHGADFWCCEIMKDIPELHRKSPQVRETQKACLNKQINKAEDGGALGEGLDEPRRGRGGSGRPGLLTVHDDLNVLEVDLPAGQDPALTAVSAFICFPDAPDLEVVVGQDYESD